MIQSGYDEYIRLSYGRNRRDQRSGVIILKCDETRYLHDFGTQTYKEMRALGEMQPEIWMSNFRRLVLGCIDSYDSEQRRILS